MLFRTSLLLILLSITTRSSAQTYGAEILNESTQIEIKGNKLVKNYSCRILMLDRSGEKLTKIKVPFSKMIRLSNLEGCIKTLDGNMVRKLKSSDCVDKSAISQQSFYEDDFVREFTMKHNVYPYIMEYSYTHTINQFVTIENWTPVYNYEFPTRAASLLLTVPKDYPIAYDKTSEIEFIKDSTENTYTYSFKGSYQKTINPEYFAPNYLSVIPLVKIVPQHFVFDIQGSQTNWIEFGNWQYNMLKTLNKLPVQEQNTIDKLIAGITDDNEKIKILYHYLQDQTRYINVTIETGGLKPYPAEYVSTNKYGDCKALSNYFKSVLDYVGIPANYVLVYADETAPDINTSFTSSQFNHAMVMVPLKSDTLWLDCTSSMAFGYYGTFTQNRPALVIKENQTKFEKIPQLKPNQTSVDRKFTIELDGLTNANIEVANIYRGRMFEMLASLGKNYNQNQQTQILHDDYTERGFTNFSNLVIHPYHRDSTSVKLTYTANSNTIYRNYGNELITNLIPFNIPGIEKPEKRNMPIQIDYPIQMIDTIVFINPADKKLSAIFNNQNLEGRYGQFNIVKNNLPDKTLVVKRLIIYPGKYKLDEYPEFYKFYNSVRALEANSHLIYKN